MVHYYLDLEVYSKGERPDPAKDRILLATICPFDPATGQALGNPALLRAWETGEAHVVRQLVQRFFGARPFDAVPVGFNLPFDLWFIKHRARACLNLDLGDAVFVDKPYLDLKQAAVLANKGVFKGVKLADGKDVRDWYEAVDLARIEQHARQKLVAFTSEYARLARKLR